ncbi:MAG: hypothetical protein PWQ17_2610 [Anaerophaga sp.]|uniref:hypothetical protein n=1 Tax=Anaerophaga thermohalophila TaxID=177400 RepID=UPI000237CA8A|nr:hypothetical protein [Anaerophaga thermohalophila]MDK2843103.1 hypothetical protein [Anaerophaga sp.]MDN5292379.1 hypothetical protein [Anaerophaga sp.]
MEFACKNLYIFLLWQTLPCSFHPLLQEPEYAGYEGYVIETTLQGDDFDGTAE